MLTRRGAIGAIGAIALAPGPAFATSAGGLAFVFLRGGLDGLAAVPPHGDPAYRTARGALALERDAWIDLDGFFGLHRSLAPLRPFFDRGELVIVPAAGLPGLHSSHARARAALFGDVVGSSWPAGEEGGAATPAWLRPVAPVRVLDGGASSRAVDMAFDLARAGALPDGLAAAQMASEAARFKLTCARAGAALATGSTRLAALELSGFDCHVDQGTADGRLAMTLAALADGLVALAGATGTAWGGTAVLVVTEFGRSVAPNASRGTDHGGASTAFLMGGRLSGAGVVGRWPGLATERLVEGRAVAVATDLRSFVAALPRRG